jgi:hypothetical protein
MCSILSSSLINISTFLSFVVGKNTFFFLALCYMLLVCVLFLEYIWGTYVICFLFFLFLFLYLYDLLAI